MRNIGNIAREDGVKLLNDLHRLKEQVNQERLEGAPEIDCAYIEAFLVLKLIALGQDGLYASYDA